MKQWFHNVFIWLDEGINAIILRGNAHETISQRAAWSRDKIWGCVLCKILDSISKDHCSNAIKDVVRIGNRNG